MHRVFVRLLHWIMVTLCWTINREVGGSIPLQGKGFSRYIYSIRTRNQVTYNEYPDRTVVR